MRRYYIGPMHQPSTVGAAMDLDSSQVYAKSFPDQSATQSSPMTLISLPQEEGVDYPFFSRSLLKGSPFPDKEVERGRARFLFDLPSHEGFLPRNVEVLEGLYIAHSAALAHLGAQDAHELRKRDKAIAASLGLSSKVSGPNPAIINSIVYSTLTCHLLSEIQRHLLEPTIDGGVTWTIATQAEVEDLLNQRIARFQLETGLLETSETWSSTTDSVFDLASNLIDITRVTWDGVVLERTDEHAADTLYVGWRAVTGTPEAYVESPKPSLSIQLVPSPALAGDLVVEYTYVPTAVGAACTNMPFPTIFCWAIKWGVIADLLKREGELNDPQRALYAEGRFNEGVELAKMMVGGS